MPPVTSQAYANAIFGAGVAQRETYPQGHANAYHDIPVSTQFVRERVLEGIASLKLKGTNLSSGPAVGCVDFGKAGPKANKIVDAAIKIHKTGSAGQISIVFVGEAHTPGGPGVERREDMADLIGKSASSDVIPVLERGMTTKISGGATTIRETNVESSANYFGNLSGDFGLDKLSRDQRTIVVAGYLFAYCASDDQTRNVTFVVFFGDNHADFSKQFEYLVTAGTRFGVDWVERRPRGYAYAPSL